MTSANQVFGQLVVFSKNYLPVSRVNIEQAMLLVQPLVLRNMLRVRYTLIVTGTEPLDFMSGTETIVRRGFVCS